MSQVNSLQDFIEKAENIHEYDMGDFKRKMGAYINRLEETIPSSKRTNDVKRGLMSLRQTAIYNTNDDVESTRLAVIEVAKSIKLD